MLAVVTGTAVTGEEDGLSVAALTLPPVRVTLVKIPAGALSPEEQARYGVTDAGAVLVLECDGALRCKLDAVPEAVNELRQALLNEDPEPDPMSSANEGGGNIN